MRKETKEYWKATVLYVLGITIASTSLYLFLFYNNDKHFRQHDNLVRLKECYKMNMVNTSILPENKDVNQDGLKDLVLKLESGENLVLYKTSDGYNYKKPGENVNVK